MLDPLLGTPSPTPPHLHPSISLRPSQIPSSGGSHTSGNLSQGDIKNKNIINPPLGVEWQAQVSPNTPHFGGQSGEPPIMGIRKSGEELFSIPLPHCAPPLGLISENLLCTYYMTALSAADQQGKTDDRQDK